MSRSGSAAALLFPAQIIFKGHEYVACQARKAGIGYTNEGNCFTHIANVTGLAKIADTLSEESAIGRLAKSVTVGSTPVVCASLWIWKSSRTVGSGRPSAHRPQPGAAGSGQHQNDSRLSAPAEVSHPREAVRRMGVAVEKPTYDLTIFRLHGGKLTLQIYTQGERVLRIEAMAHNVAELDWGRSVDKFPASWRS